MIKKTSSIYNLSSMQILANRIASAAGPGDSIALIGELGAGKTTLASYIVQELTDANQIATSPTYQIIKIYNGRIKVAHADLYRLKSLNEIEQLGLLDLLDDHVLIVEWPEMIMNFINGLTINIKILDDYSRSITLDGDDKWFVHDGLAKRL